MKPINYSDMVRALCLNGHVIAEDNCSRSEWLNVALALKHHYHDADDIGWVIFDNWSMTGGDAYDPVAA